MRFTRVPLLAAAATLFTPGIMVSAASVMCDTLMLALWMWAAIFWIEGLEDDKPVYLAGSSLLIGLAALTKYFGISLLPLLLVYSFVRKRRFGWWILYAAIPVVLLAGYQLWTTIKYGHPMFSEALNFAESERVINGKVSPLTSTVIGLSFSGGCALTALLLSPFVWRWTRLMAAVVAGAAASAALVRGWVGLEPYAEVIVRGSLRAHPFATGVQLTLAIAGGIAVLALGLQEMRKWRDSDALFLGLWILGTFVFTAFLNWTVNARSVMPLIPAVAIVLARRLEHLNLQSRELQRRIALALLLSGAVSLWLTKADSEMANSAREAATLIRQQVANQPGNVWFQGHWGFQYYMQLTGARPVDFMKSRMDKGDLLVVPENNADAFRMPLAQFVASTQVLQMQLRQPLSTMRWHVAAGFYSSFYGPLPFAFGPVDTERYFLFRLSMPMARRIVYGRHEGMVNGSVAPNAPGYR
jgi:4-amino-4-deoxy-L-arabinose transferase-like glycosyltransferase